MKRINSVSVIVVILFITKIIGFIKIRVIAQLFGASDRDLDIFWAAFTIPDMIFNVLVAGSINAAVIPIFSDVLHKKGEEKLIDLFLRLNALLSVLMLILGGISFVFAKEISQMIVGEGLLAQIFQTSSQVGKQDVTLMVQLMRIMLLSPFILGISSLSTAYLQVHKRFFITSLAPLLYNVIVVFVSIWFVRYLDLGVMGMAWAVVLGSVAHYLVQMFTLFDTPEIFNFKDHLYHGIMDKDAWKILRLAFPRVLSLFAEHFNLIINTFISFTLTAGSLSAYRFAFNLYNFPVHILGGAVSQVAHANMSELYAKGDREEFVNLFHKAVQQTIYVILPFVAMFLILRLPIVRLALGSGKFTWEDTIITSWCLALLSLSIVAQAVVGLQLRAFYAIHETKLPLLVSLLTMVVNIAASYYFTNFFSHYLDWRPIITQVLSQLREAFVSGNSGTALVVTLQTLFNDLGNWFTTRNTYNYAVGGLATGMSISFIFEMVMYFVILQKKVHVLSYEKFILPSIKKFLIFTLATITMYFSYKFSDLNLDTSRTINVFVVFCFAFGMGFLVYYISSKLLKIKEVEIFDKLLSIGFNRSRFLLNILLKRLGLTRFLSDE